MLVGIAGATYDIVIDAYRIETLKPSQLGVGSGMSQYGWRIGSAAAGALALVVAGRFGWTAGYAVCAVFALPAMLTGLVVGEPARHVAIEKKGASAVWASIIGPFVEFMRRSGAWLVLLFVLVHKIGDTLSRTDGAPACSTTSDTRTTRSPCMTSVSDSGPFSSAFSSAASSTRSSGLKRSVLIALVLMGVSNFSFALLAASGHSNPGLAGAIGFENFASGYGGVVVVAYFSALCNLQFTATQYALISATASVLGRVLTGGTAGALIQSIGYVNFYLLTTVLALPGILLFWFMMRAGMIDRAMGTAGRVGG